MCAVAGINTAVFKTGMTFVFMDKQTAAIAGDPAIGRSLRDVAVCPVGLWDIVKYGGGGRQGRSRAAQESHNGYETGSQGSG